MFSPKKTESTLFPKDGARDRSLLHISPKKTSHAESKMREICQRYEQEIPKLYLVAKLNIQEEGPADRGKSRGVL